MQSDAAFGLPSLGYTGTSDRSTGAAEIGIDEMADDLRLTMQVLVSMAIIVGVVWWVWRLPGEAITESASAPYLSLGSVWAGLAAVLHNFLLVKNPFSPVTITIGVVLYAIAISAGYLALWTYRYTSPATMTEPIHMQRMQARIGLGLGILAVTMWYVILLNAAPVPVGPPPTSSGALFRLRTQIRHDECASNKIPQVLPIGVHEHQRKERRQQQRKALHQVTDHHL